MTIDQGSNSRKAYEHDSRVEGRDVEGSRNSRSALVKPHHASRKSTKRAHYSSILERNSIMSPVRKSRRKPSLNSFQGELRRIKPPTFNGEHKKGEEVEALLLEMRK